ncbi:MAG TPA: RNA polymerase sigma factor [Bryobacteraceae bacterium]|nr:RNA polymerase sigma factor [Bryobacteraceae bacterium]
MILPARTGNAAAFEQIVRTHERQVLRVAVRLTGNLHDGQDVAQEVFLKLHREFGRFQDSSLIGSWLYRVTVNACFDLRRKAKRAPVENAGFGWETWRSGERSREQELAHQQELALAMEELSERERAAITLRELEGLSTAQVAEILGTAESTVRVQIAAARVKLRKCLERLRGKKR